MVNYMKLRLLKIDELEQFIIDNPRIKLWIHGHVHNSFDYNIGQCHIICEPYGYFGHEQKIKPRKWYGKEINIQ